MRQYLVKLERTETHETTVRVGAESREEAESTARSLARHVGGRWTKTNDDIVASAEVADAAPNG